MKGYVYKGKSNENWTNGKIYYLRSDHFLDCPKAFIDDQGDVFSILVNNVENLITVNLS